MNPTNLQQLRKESVSTAYDSPYNALHTPLPNQHYPRHLTQLPSDWCDKVKGKDSIRTVVQPHKQHKPLVISKFDGRDPTNITSTPTSKTHKKVPDAPLFKVVAWDPQRYFIDEAEVANEPVPAKCVR